MKIKYIDKSFQGSTLDLIELANDIIADYTARGYELTLRQLYYQLVARDEIPNTEKSYRRLGTTISDARDAGLVDWLAIVDRTRNRKGTQTWSHPGSILKSAAYSYKLDLWKEQAHRVWVWVEKEALAGVVQRACTHDDFRATYVSCRGYMSASTMWREARQIKNCNYRGQVPVILHLGDHDPSGIDMSRDNRERLDLYSERSEFIFERIALNIDQVEEYNPPPNPAKLKDSRAQDYVEQYGYESWELDALDPDVLVDLIRSYIEKYIDRDAWDTLKEIETEQVQRLNDIADDFEKEFGDT